MDFEVPDISTREMLGFPPNTLLREDWEADSPLNVMAKPSMDLPVRHVLVTNTGGATCDSREGCVHASRELQARHMRQDLVPDIKQNFLIGGDGNVYLGRGWVMDPWLPEDYMDKLHHTLHVSYFGPPGRQPTEGETKVLTDLIEFGIKNYFVDTKPTFHYEL